MCSRPNFDVGAEKWDFENIILKKRSKDLNHKKIFEISGENDHNHNHAQMGVNKSGSQPSSTPTVSNSPSEIGNPPCIGSMFFLQRFPELQPFPEDDHPNT